MDADDRELFRHLMSKTTTILEDTATLAAEGQSSQVSQNRRIALAGQLQAAAQDIVALSKAAAVLSSQGTNHDD